MFNFTTLLSSGVVCKAGDPDLMWAVIAPSSSSELVEITARERAASALSFASDALVFGAYNHPLTQWGLAHVYQHADGFYDDDAGIMTPHHPLSGGVYRHIRIEFGEIAPGEPYSLVLNTERVERLRRLNQPTEKIQAAQKRAEDDLRHSHNVESKHFWGPVMASGKGFKIYVAHLRPLACRYASIAAVAAKDMAKAAIMRADAINAKIFWEENLRMTVVEQADEHADAPDAPEGTEAPAPVVAAPEIVFRLIKNDRLTSEMVNLAEHVGKRARLFDVRRGVPLTTPSAWWTVDMEQRANVARWLEWSKRSDVAVTVG